MGNSKTLRERHEVFGGRKARELTQDEMDLLNKMGGIRLPLTQMAYVLGMSKSSLQNILKKNDAAKETLEKGKAVASFNARDTLYSQAISGKNTTALIFWCKTQEGMREVDRVELTGEDGGPIETSELTKAERLATIKKLNKHLEATEDE